MVSAALLASKIIARESPRYLSMVGICAGIQGKANIGDLVVGDPIWDWQAGKHFVEKDRHEFAIEPDALPLSGFIRARFEQLKADKDTLARIRSGWPEPPDTELKLRIAPMASGSSVLADSDKIKDQNRNLTAIEMEGYGVAAASSWASRPKPTVLVCKGVSDFANEEKNDKWRAYAAYCSAVATSSFFEKNMIDLADMAGSS